MTPEQIASVLDIDLALVKPLEEPAGFDEYREKLGREIQVFTAERLADEVKNNLVNGIVLSGRWDPL